MRVKLMSWASWSANPANGTACCRSCEKVIRGLDFYEAENLDTKGRRFLCAKCVADEKAEIVADFGPLAEGPVVSRPMSEMLGSHVAKIRGMVEAAIQAHEKKCHADNVGPVVAPKRPVGRPRKFQAEAKEPVDAPF